MVFWFIILVTVISSSASALKITEVESNPAGEDRGNEWVELYSQDEVDLSSYLLFNSKGKNVSLEGRFSGYKVIVFSGLWLVNTNESVSLVHNGETIDQTSVLKDSNNDERTWSRCDSTWTFGEATRERENTCGAASTPLPQPPQTNSSRKTKKKVENVTTTVEESVPAVQPLLNPANFEEEKIVLNTAHSSEGIEMFETRDAKVQRYVIYAFSGFCVLLIILLALKKL